MFDMKQAGIRIKELREKKGDSQEVAAEIVGVSLSAYQKYEIGNRVPRDEVKERISNYLGKSISFIFFNH